MPHGYTTLRHYIGSSKWAIDDLTKERIKISLFNAVNDKQELCAYTIDDFPNPAIENLTAWITDTKALLCFSPIGNDEYMWTRYGGAHRGVCFVMRVPDKYLLKVRYVDAMEHQRMPGRLLRKLHDQLQRGKPSWTVTKEATKYIIPFFTTKFRGEWEQENETRILLKKDEVTKDDDGAALYYSDMRTNGLLLKEVILGDHCPESVEHIKGLVNDRQSFGVRVSRESSGR